MTSTAAAWRHVDGVGDDDECWGGGIAESGALVCGCTTPTPDPASQAVYMNMETGEWESAPPTRCLCGHTLEAVR